MMVDAHISSYFSPDFFETRESTRNYIHYWLFRVAGVCHCHHFCNIGHLEKTEKTTDYLHCACQPLCGHWWLLPSRNCGGSFKFRFLGKKIKDCLGIFVK